MDGHRFDALTRSFAASGSRRRLLKGVVGGAVGGLLVRFGFDTATSAPAAQEAGSFGQGCRRDSDCFDGNPCTMNACLKKPYRWEGVCVSSPRPRGTRCRDEDDGNPCTRNVCDGSGNCSLEPLPNGAFCEVDDHYPGRCQDGMCVADLGGGDDDGDDGDDDGGGGDGGDDGDDGGGDDDD
jgi:hypothetical protein